MTIKAEPGAFKIDCKIPAMDFQLNHMYRTMCSHLIPVVVKVADDCIGLVHELLSSIKGRRERVEGGAPVSVPVTLEVPIHDEFELERF